MRGMMTNLRPETFENLQLGPGVLMTGFAWRDGESADALRGRLAAFLKAGKGLLGAAKNGRFSCVPRLRAPEGAARNPYRGGWVTDGWDIRLSAVLMEITPGQFARALGCAQVKRFEEGLTVVRPGLSLSEEDYLPDLCWAGEHGKGLLPDPDGKRAQYVGRGAFLPGTGRGRNARCVLGPRKRNGDG